MTRYDPPTPRKGKTKAQLAKIFVAADGICHICRQQIRDGERWDAEHVTPLSMGGADNDTNLRPAHVKCHRAKSNAEAGQRAKRNETIARGYVGNQPKRGFRKPTGTRYDWKAKRYVRIEEAP